MPRFRPALCEVFKTLPDLVIEVASGRRRVETDSLAPMFRQLVAAVRVMQSRGIRGAEIRQLLSRLQSQPDELLDATLRDFFSNDDLATARVYCVTDTLGNKHLWDDYADQGRGCVLEFRHVAAADSPLVRARPVEYSADAPVVDGASEFLMHGPNRTLKERMLSAVCLSKGLHYRPECEWRVVTWEPDDPGSLHSDYSFDPRELASVTVGPHVDPIHLEGLRAVLRQRYLHAILRRMPAGYDLGRSCRFCG